MQERFGVTADVVALTIRDGHLMVLLVERAYEPFAGHRALPGGFVETETLAEAALRELAEETSLAGPLSLELVGCYGDPGRDPRMRVVTAAYLAFAPDLPDPVAGDDAAGASWVDVADATDLAFDHDLILADALELARSRLEHTPFATAFLGEEFTLADLQAVYETVWGEPVDPARFQGAVLAADGFVSPAGAPPDGSRATRYSAGGTDLLYPPLLRPSHRIGPL